MIRYRIHIFVCTNERAPGNSRGSCALKGGRDLVTAFKTELEARGLTEELRVNRAGCLDMCEQGPAVVIYPEGIWYGKVTLDDVKEIVDSHIIGGKVVERLLVQPL